MAQRTNSLASIVSSCVGLSISSSVGGGLAIRSWKEQHQSCLLLQSRQLLYTPSCTTVYQRLSGSVHRWVQGRPKKKLFALLVLGYLIRASAFGHGALPRIRYFPLTWVYVINPSHASRTFGCHVVSLAKRFSFVSLRWRLLTSFLNSSSS